MFSKKFRNQLWDLYLPFEIVISAIFLICLIPLFGIWYLTFGDNFIGLWIIAIPLSICNLSSSFYKNDPARTKTWDLIIVPISILTLIPIVGWGTAAAGLGFSVHNIIKYNKKYKVFK